MVAGTFSGGVSDVSHTEFTTRQQQALHDPWQWTRFQFGPAGAIGIVALWMQWPAPALAWQAFWTLMTAYCMFCWTSCFHETVHQTLTANRNTSIWLGRFIGTSILIPYSVYRESHIRHHAYLNKPTDWELWPYSDPKAGIGFRRLYVWFDLLLGTIASIVSYGRIYWHRDSPITDPQLRRTIAREYAFAVFFWAVVVAAVAVTDSWGGFLRGWIIPTWVAGFFQSIRKFTEHLGMSSYDPLVGARTVVGQNWFTRMCTYLNFDIFVHGPHHRHPLVPHRTLKQKMQEYVEKQPELQYPMFRTYGGAILDTIPYMFRNPGVGMNMGGVAPDKEKKKTENFVADVVEEVLSEEDRVSTTV